MPLDRTGLSGVDYMVSNSGEISTSKLEVVIVVALFILVAAILSFITAQCSIYSPPRERDLPIYSPPRERYLPTIHKVHTLASSNSSNNGGQTSQTVDKNH